ncbi:hypothetical protein PHDIMM138B_25525 [Phytobacter diazotrophicus]
MVVRFKDSLFCLISVFDNLTCCEPPNAVFFPAPANSGAGLDLLKTVTGGCQYGYDPPHTRPLLAVSFNVATDFTIFAEHCENFAETLIENDDPSLKMALCGRLSIALTLLQPMLLEPVPPHLVESLTVDTLPANSSEFGLECTELCRYCLS